MTLGERMASYFQMGESTWQRHANPWSVWSRTTVLPLLILAVWSRVWLGWWALVPIGFAALWTWLNPRLFPAPASLDNWASKSVMGERIWIGRDEVPVPQHHRRAPKVLNGVSVVGTLVVVWGIISLQAWPTLFGLALVYAGKLWFLDRMVWLFEDVKDDARVHRTPTRRAKDSSSTSLPETSRER